MRWGWAIAALAGCRQDLPAETNLTEVRLTADPALVTSQIIEFDLATPAAATLTCTEASGDRFTLRAESAALQHFELRGLLPATDYDCEADAGGSRPAEIPFTTGELPDDVPVVTATGAPLWGAYTLFNQVRKGSGQKLVIVDPEGRVRWYRYLEGDPNVGIEASLVETNTFLAGGGDGYNASLIDESGARTWVGPAPLTGGVYHHDTQYLPTGQIMSLVTESDRAGALGWLGFSIEIVDRFTSEVDWTFSSQVASDAGQLPVGASNGDDTYHANAISWVEADPEGPAIWTSLKMLNQIVRIDAVTGEVGWRLGVGGDFAFQDANGDPITDPALWFYGEHGPDYTMRDGDPNLWRFWVHDNGYLRPGDDPHSRAIALDVDLAARTAKLVWSFSEDGWFEPVFGDVDALPTGDAFVTQGHCPQCDGAPNDRGSNLVDVDLATNQVAWRYVMAPSDSTYRAQRLDGCALFHNERYCP